MYTPSTLADLKQSLADRANSGVLPTKAATLSLWIRLLNRGVAYCVRRLGLYTTTSLTTSSGTVALPSDFKAIFRVFKDTTELVQIGADDTDQKTGYSFWITGDPVNGYHLNTPTDMSLTVSYYDFQPNMVNDSDVCVISDPEAPVAYAYGMLRKSQSDPFEDANQSLAECDARLTELKSDQMANNDNIGFTLQTGA